MSTETTSQERFVVVLAFLAGLAMFAWLFSGPSRRLPVFEERDGTEILRTDASLIAEPVISPALVSPDKPKADPLAKLEKRVVELDEELNSRVDQLASDQANVVIPAPVPVDGLKQTDAELKLSLDEQTRALANLNHTLENKESELSALQVRLGQLEAASAKPVETDVKLAERIRLLEWQLGRLRNDTAQSRLFVDSGENLGGKAALLFARLGLLKNATPPEVDAEYQKIEPELRAKSVARIRYDSAESEVPETNKMVLEQLVDASPNGTYFLVAGYADTTGEPEANRVLSSKRASNVAELLDRRLKPGQTARAVYLGQTARFGPEQENRVVEIWSIQP